MELWAEADCVASEPTIKAQAITLELRMDVSRVFFMTRSPLEGIVHNCLHLIKRRARENSATIREKPFDVWRLFTAKVMTSPEASRRGQL
jgi:hypothetical protein